MGQLKPGATYIYERANGVIYAREEGAVYSDRFPIGWDADLQQREVALWNEIWQAAKTNQTLQSALDNVIMLYHLSKEQDGEST